MNVITFDTVVVGVAVNGLRIVQSAAMTASRKQEDGGMDCMELARMGTDFLHTHGLFAAYWAFVERMGNPDFLISPEDAYRAATGGSAPPDLDYEMRSWAKIAILPHQATPLERAYIEFWRRWREWSSEKARFSVSGERLAQSPSRMASCTCSLCPHISFPGIPPLSGGPDIDS